MKLGYGVCSVMQRLKVKFLVRREPFGSLIYDFQTEDYLAFDADATLLFEQSVDRDVNRVYEQYFSSKITWISFMTFYKLCKSIGIFNEDNKFAGEFINQREFPKDDTYLSAPTILKLNLNPSNSLRYPLYEPFRYHNVTEKLSDKIWGELLKELADIGTFHVHVLPEPFIELKALKALLKSACEYNIRVTLFTYLANLPKDIFERIPPELWTRVREIRVRLDGVTDKTYMSTMGRAVFSKVKANIKMLFDKIANLRIEKVMETYIVKFNLSDIPSFVRFAESMGFDNITFRFPLIVPIKTGDSNLNDKLRTMLVNPNEVFNIARLLRELEKNTEITIDLYALPNPFRLRNLHGSYGCPCGRSTMYMASDGSMYPSECFAVAYPYEVKRYPKVSLLTYWHNDEFLDKLRHIDRYDTKCESCPFLSTCQGGCRARAFLLKGNLRLRDPLCPLYPMQL